MITKAKFEDRGPKSRKNPPEAQFAQSISCKEDEFPVPRPGRHINCLCTKYRTKNYLRTKQSIVQKTPKGIYASTMPIPCMTTPQNLMQKSPFLSRARSRPEEPFPAIKRGEDRNRGYRLPLKMSDKRRRRRADFRSTRMVVSPDLNFWWGEGEGEREKNGSPGNNPTPGRKEKLGRMDPFLMRGNRAAAEVLYLHIILCVACWEQSHKVGHKCKRRIVWKGY